MLVYNVEINSPFRRVHKWQEFRRQRYNEKKKTEMDFHSNLSVSCCIVGAACVKWKSFLAVEQILCRRSSHALRRHHFSCTLHTLSCNRGSSRKLVIHLVALSECASTHMIYCNHSIQWHFSKSSQCDFDTSTSWDNSSSNKSPLFTIRRNHMLHYDDGDAINR